MQQQRMKGAAGHANTEHHVRKGHHYLGAYNRSAHTMSKQAAPIQPNHYQTVGTLLSMVLLSNPHRKVDSAWCLLGPRAWSHGCH